jgi:hypothetical protein
MKDNRFFMRSIYKKYKSDQAALFSTAPHIIERNLYEYKEQEAWKDYLALAIIVFLLGCPLFIYFWNMKP